MFCRSLFVLLFFFSRPLCWMFFFDIRILITPLVCSNSSWTRTGNPLTKWKRTVIDKSYSCISFIQDAHARLCKCNPYTSEKQMKSVRYQNIKSRQTHRNVYYLEQYLFKSHSRVTRWVPHVEQLYCCTVLACKLLTTACYYSWLWKYKICCFSFLCCIVGLVCLRYVSRLPNVASVSKLSIRDCPFGFL
jgi:hypothetical protein